MSRCPNPRACACNFETEDESVLKCGPCRKCLRKSEQMKCDWDAMRTGKINRTVTGPIETQPSAEETPHPGWILGEYWIKICLIVFLLIGVMCIGMDPVVWLSIGTLTSIDALILNFSKPQLVEGWIRRSVVSQRDNFWGQGFSHAELKSKQDADPVLKQVLSWVIKGEVPAT